MLNGRPIWKKGNSRKQGNGWRGGIATRREIAVNYALA
jgi:hypothetical protein